MSKLSSKETLILQYIVTNCEIFHLNEREALEYIRNNLPKAISKRTHYYYKNLIYKIQEEQSVYFKLFKIQGYNNHRDLISLLFLIENKKMKKEVLKEKNIRLAKI